MQPGDDAALLIGFLNTVHLPDGVDALANSTPDQWLADGRTDDGRSLHELPAHSRRAAAGRGVASLVVLREGLRVLLKGRDDRRSESDPTASRDLVAEADLVLESVALRLSLDAETGAPTLRPAGHSRGDSGLATVAAAVVRTQLDGSLSRVKVCARATCRWAYFDASRNRSRQWCSMAGCGNVEKNRAYRARRSGP